MLGKRLQAIEAGDLQSLVSDGVAESQSLEFKRDFVGLKHDESKEFLADVSALANSSGGDLIFGISEKDSVADEVCGVSVDNRGAAEERLRNLLRDGLEPQLAGVDMKWVELEHGKVALVVRIPRSWAAPHRVTISKHNEFYIRDGNVKHPMNVERLRRSFLLGDTLIQNLRNVRLERLSVARRNEEPLPLMAGPKLVVQIVPLLSMISPLMLSWPDDLNRLIVPLGDTGFHRLYTLEGLVTYSGPEQSVVKPVRAYTLMFRNGMVEFVANIGRDHAGTKYVYTDDIFKYLQSAYDRFRDYAKRYEIHSPVVVFASILDVRGYRLYLKWAIERGASGPLPVRREEVLFPEVIIDTITGLNGADHPMKGLEPLIWNAFGVGPNGG